ncbi:hypothetical protein BDF14DRAFT_542544 [Spinellus fusiger]|nr:hypothetical protein BDF14DRAFT_542544 [Spinellus fusiger]
MSSASATPSTAMTAVPSVNNTTEPQGTQPRPKVRWHRRPKPTHSPATTPATAAATTATSTATSQASDTSLSSGSVVSTSSPQPPKQHRPKQHRPRNRKPKQAPGGPPDSVSAPGTVQSSSQSPVSTHTTANTHTTTKSIRAHRNRAQGRLTAEGSKQSSPQQHTNHHSYHARKGPAIIAPESDDLASGLAYELKTSKYECMVCWDVVRPAHATWTCDCCWAVFHIHCVQTWATKSLQDLSTNKMITSWRCPGCQYTRTGVPKDYLCFCGKQRNPELNKYLTPHSCGQLCKKSRLCPHPCVLPCHPGPCSPCTAMGPLLTCFCGRHSRQTRCADTDYSVQGYQCEEVCGEVLGCEKHKCKDMCHSGLCSPCTVEEVQLCYCGRHERTSRCGSGKAIEIKGHVGHYSCGDVCDSTYACGYHRCEATCHPCESTPMKCPYDPSVVSTCPCGAEKIEVFGTHQRTRCTDPMPSCGRLCPKQLPCGHPCQQTCHTRTCPPCKETVQVACRCQSTASTATCASVSEAEGGDVPECSSVCRSMRQCGRHPCGIVCCPLAKSKGGKKKRQGGSDTAHECPLVCGRVLSCGKHPCQERCHKGRCPPCMEANFDEVTCHCQRTRLEPPIRCGTQLPLCPYPCQRPAACGHMRLLQHNCHPDEEPCPPCSILTTRTCVCGKTDLKSVPCYREFPRCGRLCDGLLECGKHRCIKTCHNGPCLTDSEVCQQMCDGIRSCGHPCKGKCHPGACLESDPCSVRIRTSCECGQHVAEMPCRATGESSGSQHVLPCDALCAKVQRNRKLAMALDIQRDEAADTLSMDDLGYYDATLREFYRDHVSWCVQVEKMLIEFCTSPRQTLHCKPMRSPLRQFIHRYAIHFHFTTEAVDHEPKRSVIVRKTAGQSRVPPLLLSKAAFNLALGRVPVVEPLSAEESVGKTSHQPVNAVYLSDLAIGLTHVELDLALLEICGQTKVISRWVDDSDAMVIPLADTTTAMDEREDNVWRLKRLLKAHFVPKGTCSRVDCCWLNKKGIVTWTEKQTKPPAASSSVPNGQRHVNAFEVLSNEDEEWMRVTSEKSSVSAWEEETVRKNSREETLPHVPCPESAVELPEDHGKEVFTSEHGISLETPAQESSDDWEVVTA